MTLAKKRFSNEQVIKILDQYDKSNASEKIAEYSVKLQDSSQSLISRKNFLGHVVASAIVFDSTLSKVLLIEHKKLNKYIQPGGHVDKTDESFCFAAKRELEEETGLSKLSLVPFNKEFPDIPIDIDIHTIPKNEKKQEAEHPHIDFRYFFVLEKDEEGRMNEAEIRDMLWRPIKEFEAANPDLARVVQKCIKLLSERRNR